AGGRRGGRPADRRGHGRVHRLRAHPAAAREHRRDRRQGDGAVERSPHPPLPVAVALTILEGSTFCICDERGDLDGPTHGLYASDTRFLSRFALRVNGEVPLLLSSGKVEYFSAAFYLRNPIAGGLEQDQVAVTRERFVGDGMQELIVLQNLSGHALSDARPSVSPAATSGTFSG